MPILTGVELETGTIAVASDVVRPLVDTPGNVNIHMIDSWKPGEDVEWGTVQHDSLGVIWPSCNAATVRTADSHPKSAKKILCRGEVGNMPNNRCSIVSKQQCIMCPIHAQTSDHNDIDSLGRICVVGQLHWVCGDNCNRLLVSCYTPWNIGITCSTRMNDQVELPSGISLTSIM